MQRLPRRLVEALIEENSLNPRPDFVLQATRRGFVRIIAHRSLRSELAPPLKVVTRAPRGAKPMSTPERNSHEPLGSTPEP